MRVKSIKMEDFGPYVSQEIDFTELNEQRLFLLQGKTGSGKSTIIEAIVFALFGKDSKGRDSEKSSNTCILYTSQRPRDATLSSMTKSA